MPKDNHRARSKKCPYEPQDVAHAKQDEPLESVDEISFDEQEDVTFAELLADMKNPSSVDEGRLPAQK